MNINSQKNSSINNNQSKENSLNTTNTLIQALVAHFNENPQGFSTYRKEIDSLLKENIKPISSRSCKSGNDWKEEVKNRFGGRGAKWVFVSLEEVESTISMLENQGINCDNYRKWTKKVGKAWIRYTAARIHDGIKCAGFAILNEGSTINKPKQLHFIDLENLDNVIEAMPGTPKSLKLEEDSAPLPKSVKIKKEKKKLKKEESNLEVLSKEINLEMEIEKELSESPESSDPEEWEAFLAAEGLLDYEIDDNDF